MIRQHPVFTRPISITFSSEDGHFRKRKFLSVVMPQPSPRLHLPHSVACDDFRDLSKLSHQACTSASSNANLDCKMNVRKLLESIPQRQRDAEGDSDSGCTIRARKKHDRHDGRAVMVFRRTGAGKKKRPCGMPHCPTCGVFWRKCISCFDEQPY